MTAPTLVLLPGLDGTGVLLRPLLEQLPADVQTVVVSYPPDRPLAYAELLPIVLAALPGSSPFVILGESFSGPLALMAAATRPAGLRGVILCASFIERPIRWAPPWLAPFVRPLLFRLYPVVKAIKATIGGYSTPALRALTAEALAELRPEVLACRVRSVLRVDVTRELAASPVPILYLRGERDIVVGRHNLEAIRAVVPPVEVARISSPHMILQIAPAEAAASIAKFLASVEGGAPGPPDESGEPRCAAM